MGNKRRASESIQTSSTKDSDSFCETSQNFKIQNRTDVTRLGKSTDKNSNGKSIHVCYSIPSYSSQKRHGQGERVQELVKYMSRVPSYLQLLEKDDTRQKKALNMGVIDWGHLQKWNDSHRPVVNREGGNPSSRCAPSSSKVCGDSSSVGLKKASSAPRHFHEPYRGEDHVQVGLKKASMPFSNFLNLGSTSHIVGRHGISTSCSEFNCEIKHEKHKANTTNSKILASGSSCNSQEFESFRSTSSIVEVEEMLHPDKPNVCTSGLPDYDSKQILQDRPLGSVPTIPDYDRGDGQRIDGIQTVEDLRNWSDRFSFESAGSENPCGVSNSRVFSGVFLSEDLQHTTQYSDVPHSCPFPLNSRGNELLEGTEAHQRSSMSNALTPPPDLKYWKLHADDKECGSECSKNNKDVGDTMGPCPVTVGRSCPKEVTTLKQLNMFVGLDSSKTTCPPSSKGRSPLRKMINTLLKPRVLNHRPGTVSASPINVVRRFSFARKTAPREDTQVRWSLHVSADVPASSTAHVDRRKSVSSALASNSQGGEPQGLKCETSERQLALMRLTWKDQLPVFTFSMNNSDVLVATRKRTLFPHKYDSHCCYTIYSLSEARKSIGAWVNQGSKQKEFVSRAVGKMFYSCHLCHESDENNSVLERKFVLIGPELRPTAVPKLQFVRGSELAAFVIRLPECAINNSAPDLRNVADPIDSFDAILTEESSYDLPAATDKTLNDASCCDTIAILPREVHGWTDSGGPSPLIERWKSGGICDCGGWDVGCSYTVLAGNLRERKSKGDQQPAFTTEGMLHAKLFVQGGLRESTPIFQLRQITDGLYEVEFEPCIATLQAFSLCVALLHCQRPESLPQAPSFLQQLSVRNHHIRKAGRAHAEASNASYVPHHPPHSPVGRA